MRSFTDFFHVATLVPGWSQAGSGVALKNISMSESHQTNKTKQSTKIGSIFHFTGPLCEEYTGHRWIPLTKASDAELWCFLWSPFERTIEQTIETPVIWDAFALTMTLL